MSMADLDGFFLTAGLATPALRAKVEDLRDQIYGLERAYQAEHVNFIGVESDLAKMEQKAIFVQNQLEKTLAILSPPAEGEMEEVYDILEQYVHDPLNYVSTGMMGVGSLMFLVGKIGGRGSEALAPKGAKGGPIPGSKLGKPGAAGGLKPGARIGKSVKALSSSRRMSAAAGKITKATKWTKVAKVGSKLGAIGLLIAAVDFGLSLATAAEMNAHFKKQAAAMKKNIAEGEEAIAALKEQVALGRAAVKTLLAESGVESVEAFVQQLNEAIADLGQKSANISVARRMLLDGFIPPERILAYVPSLAAEALAELQQKLAAERSLIDGALAADVANQSGLPLAKVQLLARLQSARAALMAGASVDEAAEDAGVPRNLADGEDDTLQGDLQALWPQIDAQGDAGQVARLLLVPVEAVATLYAQLEAKQRLHGGESAEAVADALGVALPMVEGWRDDLEAAVPVIATQGLAAGLKAPDMQIAADLLLPLSLVHTLSGRAAA